jgi:hypothetical protein
MKKIIILFILSLVFINLRGQRPEDTEDWSRRPEVVTPGKGNLPPSDALILYGGPKDISKWMHPSGDQVQWKAGKELTVEPGSESLISRQAFGDVQLHIEWRTPSVIEGKGQGRGNSGIYFMRKYEVQVLDSYENETYYNGQAASIYKQHIPLVNASRKPGEWQVYDIIFTAPRFGADSTLVSPAYFTVIHNGVLVQNHVEVLGGTSFIGTPKFSPHPEKLPLLLQEHGNPVSYRNIWIREL